MRAGKGVTALPSPGNRTLLKERLAGAAVVTVVLALVYNAGVVAMQVNSRALNLGGAVNTATIMVHRFVLFTVLVVIGIFVCKTLLKRWFGHVKFRPVHLRASIGQGFFQGIQTTCIIAATGFLTGQFQSNLSLTILPLWTVAVEFAVYKLRLRSERKKKPEEARLDEIKRPNIARILLGSSAYALIGYHTIGDAGLGENSTGLFIGIGLMVLSGLSTALLFQCSDVSVNELGKRVKTRLQQENPGASKDRIAELFNQLPKHERQESALTTAFWQNMPAAVAFFPVLFLPLYGDGVGQARLVSPIDETATFALLVGVVGFSLLQQVATFGYLRTKPDNMPKSKISLLRGVQVIMGAASDLWFFAVAFTLDDWWVAAAVLLVIVASFGAAERDAESKDRNAASPSGDSAKGDHRAG
jgi:hypothetical protein